MNSEATDWDAYYKSVPSYTSVTRRISANKIVGAMRPFAGKPVSICEIGGANSCFVDFICDNLPVAKYHIVDANAYGLSLLSEKSPKTQLTSELADVLTPYSSDEKFDIVYSVGLIEHFNKADTRIAIDGHFDRCKPGGMVLITFPTPTVLYRTIRSVAEGINRWSFPDERPLKFDEVRNACEKHGKVLHESINWAIGLTQGYIVTVNAP